jgi:glycosyltransferase involved in cell wall biosynthesis
MTYRMAKGELPHVLQLSTATDWRGGEQQVAYLCQALDRMGVPQTLLCPDGAPLGDRMAEAGIRVCRFRPGMALDLFLARRLARVAHGQCAQLVHTHDSHGHTAAVLANTLFGMGLPLVVARRVDFPIHSGFSARFKYGHASVRRILCVSDAIRHITAKGLRDPSVLRTIRSGVDPARSNVQPDGRLRKALGVPPGTPLVGCVAALAPHKDLGTFLRTMALLRDGGSTAHGVLIGEGGMRTELEALREELGLKEHVHLTGFREDVPWLLRELDLFLITSRTEGLGTSILDAFACDLPVVATKAGGIPEIVHHGTSGLLCPVGDAECLASAVGSVLDDAGLRHTLVQGGQQVLAMHHPGAVAHATLAEYQAVLEEQASGSG